jgi:outer membrane protein OmpA-like peptidoglycan-associated protein
LHDDVLFDSGRSRIDDDQAETVASAVAEITRYGEPVTVVGHTDAVGTDQDNELLGLQRATAVRDLLLDSGLEPYLIASVETRGERCPTADNAHEAGRALNRRVEITTDPLSCP